MSKNNNSNSKSNGNKHNNRNYRRGNSNKGKGTGKPNTTYSTSADEQPKDDSRNINNPAYYYKDAIQFTQLMNFPFIEFGGVPARIRTGRGATSVDYLTPMIAAYYINPSLPETGAPYLIDFIEGVQSANLKNYVTLSFTNPNTTGYQSMDVGYAILSVRGIIEATSFIRRAIGLAYTFSQRNRTYPRALFTAMGINGDDLMDNIGKYRPQFNTLLAKASPIVIPDDIPILHKAEKMYEKVYLDDPSTALAQSYLFVPSSVWMIDELYDSNGTGLVTTQITGTPEAPWTMGTILNVFDQMISRMLTSTTLNNIYANIIKGQKKGYIGVSYTWMPVPENYASPIEYNEEVKDWIHNATILGEPLATADQKTAGLFNINVTNANDVRSEAGYNRMVYHPQFKVATPLGVERFIDFESEAVNDELKCRALRFSHRYTVTMDSNNYYTDEVATNDYYIVRMWVTGNGGAFRKYTSNAFTGTAATTVLNAGNDVTKFHWSPLFYFVTIDNSDPFAISDMRIFGDLSYYTPIDYEYIKSVYDYEVIHELEIG